MKSKIFKEITIPTIDISMETARHTIIARGSQQNFEGHPNTLLMPDGHTIFCVWQARHDSSGEHGAPVGNLKRSDDGGITWSSLLTVPENWREIGRGSPTIHRLVDRAGASRIFVFCRDEERTSFLQAVSEDNGITWSPMQNLLLVNPKDDPITGWTAPISILEAKNANGVRKHLMWYERDRNQKPYIGVIWQSASYDGGLTWGESKPVVTSEEVCEPCAIRSPDGKQLMLLIRNGHQVRSILGNSLYAISNDEGLTWSEARQLPAALTGDRHLARYSQDGRLVVVFRDTFHRGGGQLSGNDYHDSSHFVAWVGRYEDICQGQEGQYRIKLLHSYQGWNHGYPGLEILSDGTFIATTYIKYTPGDEMTSVVCTRFNLDEMSRYEQK